MTTEATQKFSLPVLTAMVVGSMVGAGIFSLPQTFGRVTGVYGALLAWVIAGVGMLMLALVFQTLAQRKPDLDAGVYAYAKAGFGNYWGFLSALGYWAGSCIGNVSYFVLIKSTLGAILSRLWRWQYDTGRRRLFGHPLDFSFPHFARHQTSSGAEHDRDNRQADTDLHFPHHPGIQLQLRYFPREPYGRW